MPGGFIGVDIFFVISGFLISTITFSSLERDRFSLSEFYIRRIRRIFPALIFVFISCLAFGWFVLFADELKQLGEHTAASAGFIQNFILLRENSYFDNSAETKPLLHLWSLAIEEQFYIFWPLLLAFVWKRQWSFLRITTVIAVVSFAGNVYLILTGAETAAFFLPFSRFWELMVGGVLAYVVLHRPQLIEKYKGVQSFVGFALVFAGFLLLNRGRDFPGGWALLPTFGAFFIISAGPSSWLNEKLLANKLVVWIGLISYPLYLWHWPLLSFAQIVVGEIPSKLIRFEAISLAFLLAWITYQFVEKPFRIFVRPIYALLIIMATTLIFGYLIYWKDGFPDRETKGVLKKMDDGRNTTVNLKVGDCQKFGLSTNEDRKFECGFVDNKSDTTVAIFGDSHAWSAFQGIAEKIKDEKNTLVLSSGGCPQLLGVYAGDTSDIKQRCEKNTKLAVSVIVNNTSINKVFIINRGNFYVTGRNYSTNDDAIAFKTPQVTMVEYMSSLQATIDIFTKSGKHVYYITENPELGFSPSLCSPRPFYIKKGNCRLDRNRVEEYQADYLAGVMRIHNAQIINSLDIFCPSGICNVINNDKILYSDSNHLSIAGSRFQAEFINNYLHE